MTSALCICSGFVICSNTCWRGRLLLPWGYSEHCQWKQPSPGCSDEQPRHCTEMTGRKRNRLAGLRRDIGNILGTKGKLQCLLLCRKSQSWLGTRAHQKTERVMAALFTILFTFSLSSLAVQNLHCLKRRISPFFLFLNSSKPCLFVLKSLF